MIRLGIVDDHPVFRLGLINALERERDLAVVWERGRVDDLSRLLAESPVDVILMDLSLGDGQDALGATTAIRTNRDNVKVIIISASLDWEAASAARAAGAIGYLPKDLPIADMLAAIRGLASPSFGRLSAHGMLTEPSRPAGSIVALQRSLTSRERQVLDELRRGRANREIAQTLGVSVTTINKHVQKVLKKLHVRTRAQAVAMLHAATAGDRRAENKHP